MTFGHHTLHNVQSQHPCLQHNPCWACAFTCALLHAIMSLDRAGLLQLSYAPTHVSQHATEAAQQRACRAGDQSAQMGTAEIQYSVVEHPQLLSFLRRCLCLVASHLLLDFQHNIAGCSWGEWDWGSNNIDKPPFPIHLMIYTEALAKS